MTWRPSVEKGLLGKLLSATSPCSAPEFAMAYSRNGMSDFTDIFGANPGISIDANRSYELGNMGPAPVLLRDEARLAPPLVASAAGLIRSATSSPATSPSSTPDLKIPTRRPGAPGVPAPDRQ